MATLAEANAEISEWLVSAEGKYWNPDGQFGIQCVDLIDQYGQDLFGVHWSQCVGGVPGAKDLPNAMPDKYWQWFANRSEDRNWAPIRGDVLVYSGTGNNPASLNYYGHTAIALEKRLDAPYVLQQDGAAQYLPASRATLVWVSPVYGRIVGWLRPRPGMVRNTGALARQNKATFVTVKPGDTLAGIGIQHGVSVVRLVQMNNIKDRNRINVGQKIRVR